MTEENFNERTIRNYAYVVNIIIERDDLAVTSGYLSGCPKAGACARRSNRSPTAPANEVATYPVANWKVGERERNTEKR